MLFDSLLAQDEEKCYIGMAVFRNMPGCEIATDEDTVSEFPGEQKYVEKCKELDPDTSPKIRWRPWVRCGLHANTAQQQGLGS